LNVEENGEEGYFVYLERKSDERRALE
jgi:hypothetical protein